MTAADRDVSAARADALKWQAQASSRPPEPANTEDTDRERTRTLECPGADVAAALLSVTGWPAVPLDDDLQPSGPPLTSYADVYRHYRQRHADGAGLTLGAHPGATIVAVHGTAEAWSTWTAEVAVERVRGRYEDGSGGLGAYRDLGRYVTVSWQPRGSRTRSSGVAVGTAAINAQGEAMRPGGASERGWVLWAIPTGERRVTFPATRKLSRDLQVLGAGVVPLHAVRSDGWQATLTNLPVVEEMPAWLAAVLGGR